MSSKNKPHIVGSIGATGVPAFNAKVFGCASVRDIPASKRHIRKKENFSFIYQLVNLVIV